jgi:hypothetical protein
LINESDVLTARVKIVVNNQNTWQNLPIAGWSTVQSALQLIHFSITTTKP